MVRGAKGDKGAQRRALRLSETLLKTTPSKQKRLGTDPGQVSK